MSENEKLYYKDRLKALGPFEATDIVFDMAAVEKELDQIPADGWKVYNKSKPGYNRFGLSLFSLDGSTDGEIDLNSIYEYNLKNGTRYGELSFRTPTPYWKQLREISKPFEEMLPFIGRSHLIKLNQAGIFPPHRDLSAAYRLIAFFNCAPNAIHFTIRNQVQSFESCRIYLADTDLVHSLVSFQEEAIILVLNIEPTKESYHFILSHLQEK